MRRLPAVSSSCARRSTDRGIGRRGITFVELLVILALSALLFAILWTLFGNAMASVQAGREGATRNRLFRLAMLHLREDLQNAVAFHRAGPGGLAFRMTGGFSPDGRPLHQEVEYASADGAIVRRGEAGETRIAGAADGLSWTMDARLDWREDGGMPRYEVALALFGADGAGDADSLEIRIVPPAMAVRRARLWSPAEEGSGGE